MCPAPQGLVLPQPCEGIPVAVPPLQGGKLRDGEVPGEGQDLAEPGGRNNVRQVPTELRERPSPVLLSALSQVQKSNLLATLLAPLGNF